MHYKCMTHTAAHIVVKGLVQGVGYRYFVFQRAQRLRIAGVVRNLPDGGVEIEAEGQRSLLEELIKELRVGPRASRVTEIAVEWQSPRHEMTEFKIQ